VSDATRPRHPAARLTFEQARQLRADRQLVEAIGRGLTVSELATKYGLSYDGVRSILQSRSYKEDGPTRE
jgi:hypothetical protein